MRTKYFNIQYLFRNFGIYDKEQSDSINDVDRTNFSAQPSTKPEQLSDSLRHKGDSNIVK